MADHLPYPDLKPHTTPRWVKVFGIIGVVMLLLFVILHIIQGQHRFGPHIHGGDTSAGQQGARQL